MPKILRIMLAGAGTAAVAMATTVPTVPEVDASGAVAALSLLAGAVLVIRGRRRK